MNKETIITTLNKIKPTLREDFGVESIALFGSFATENQTENSDVDLLIEVSENKPLDYFEEESLRRLLESVLENRKVDLVNRKFMNPVIHFFAKKNLIYV